MLPTTVSHGISGWSFFMYRLTSCIGVSAWSINTSSAGSYLDTCFTISKPIEPAAPVMSIRLPCNISPMAFISTSILSRGSRSSMSTSRSCLRASFSGVHSSVSATISIFMPALISAFCNAVSSRNTSFCIGLTTITLAPASFMCFIRLGPLRRTFTPIRYFDFNEPSLTKPHNSYWLPPSLKACANAMPPSCTPKMNAFCLWVAAKIVSYRYFTTMRIPHCPMMVSIIITIMVSHRKPPITDVSGATARMTARNTPPNTTEFITLMKSTVVV